MATKHYNKKVFSFMINGEAVSFYCSTTRTRAGFCHHVYAWGLGKENEHTRKSYYNRTWEKFDYETALYRAVEKFRKAHRAPLRLEIENIGKTEREKATAFLNTFKANFAALSDEQKEFVKKHTPHIETSAQAHAVSLCVALMAAM